VGVDSDMKLIAGKEYKCCYIVPARKSSVRIKGKNMRKVGGTPLVEWPYIESREVGVDCLVSTNCPKIIAHCRTTGIRTLIRPDSTDTDDISTLDLLYYHAKRINTYDFYGLRQCTSPFLWRSTAELCFQLSAFTGKCVSTVSHKMRRHEMMKTGALYVVPKERLEDMKMERNWIFVSVDGAEAIDIDTQSDLQEARKWAKRLLPS
jgi:CMP-N-acetylneuraminic acid synthetase